MNPTPTPRHIAIVAGFAVLIALVAALVPATPAAAAPVASTVVVSVYAGYLPVLELRAGVSTGPAGTPKPTGVVVFSEGALEIGRATLFAGSGKVHINASSPGPRTFTATYLGSADAEPSSTSLVYDVAAATAPNPVTGTIEVGNVTLSIPPGASFGQNTGTDYYEPLTGVINTAGSRVPLLETTADVPGTGPVTIGVWPFWSTQQGRVDPDGTTSFTAPTLTLLIRRIAVSGIEWGTGNGCSLSPSSFTLAGSTVADGLALAGTSAAPAALDPAKCDGRAALVNAILSGPVAVHLHVVGSYPLPVPDNPTSTSIAVSGSAFGVDDQAVVSATVTVTGGAAAKGQVEFRDNGALVATSTIASGVARAVLDLHAPGTHDVTATYTGFVGGTVMLLLPSAASTTIDVAGAPVGLPAAGQLTIGTNPPAIFPAGARLVGSAFDPDTGALGAGSLWFPAGEFLLDTPIGALVPIEYRLTQIGEMSGHVNSDGTVELTEATFEWTNRSFDFNGREALYDCTFAPIVMTLRGTADAGGLHLQADDVVVPPVSSSGCNGYGFFINPEMAGGADFIFEVEGDFRRSDATAVEVVSWFPSVARYNHTYLSAAVIPPPTPGSPAPAGEVTFRDGSTVLGVSPVDPTGHAHLAAALDHTGTRIITATYGGDSNHNAGSATTTVEVAPAPDGHALAGTVTVGATTLEIEPGSVLVPAAPGATGTTSATNGALWFMPTTITVDLPALGTTQAEVRLVQHGELWSATIAADGAIAGLAGAFVLQVRTVSAAGVTAIPLGCVALVLLAFDGQLGVTDVSLHTSGGGAGSVPRETCTGAGKAVIDHLTGPGNASADLQATL